VTATASLELSLAAEALKVAERVVADEHNIAAAAAVTAVRAAAGNVGLATEAEAAVTAATSLYVDASPIVHAMILPAMTHAANIRRARMASGGQA
jgi:hypothetical protein